MGRPSPRNVYLLLGWFQGLSMGAYFVAAMSWWVADLELSPIRLILLGTVLELTVLLAETPTGAMADNFSRRWSVVVSWLIIGVAQLFTPISELTLVLILWQALWGFGYTFQSGADTAWVTDETGGEPDDSVVMRRSISRSIGLVFGIAAGMALTQWSVAGTMVLSGVASLAFALFLIWAMTERHFSPAPRAEGRSRSQGLFDTWSAGARAISGSRVARIVVAATLVTAMADELVDRLDFARMRELGFSDAGAEDSALWFGGAWLVMTLITIPVTIGVARRLEQSADHARERTNALALLGLLALAAVGVGAMSGPIFAAALVGWGLRDVVREVAEPVSESLLNRQATSEVRATMLSFRSQGESVGQILGGVALGLVAEAVGLSTAFAAAAALLVVAALLVARLLSGPAGSEENSGGENPALR